VTALTRLLFVNALRAGGEPLAGETWNDLITSGETFGMVTHEWNDESYVRRLGVKPEDIDAMAEVFEAHVLKWFPNGVPVGVNHASLWGALDAETTKALGWIRELRVEQRGDVKVLRGLIAWTESGAERLRSGDFAYHSIEFIPAEFATDKMTGDKLGKPIVIGGTVCNDPFWPGMEPLVAPPADAAPLGEAFSSNTANIPIAVAASRGAATLIAASRPQPAPEPEPESPMLSTLIALAAALGVVSEQPSEDEVLAAAKDKTERAARADGLQSQIEILTEQRDALAGEIDEIRAAQADEIFESFCSKGRLLPAQRPAFDEMLQLSAKTLDGDRRTWSERIESLRGIWRESTVEILSEEKGHDGQELEPLRTPTGDDDETVKATEARAKEIAAAAGRSDVSLEDWEQAEREIGYANENQQLGEMLAAAKE